MDAKHRESIVEIFAEPSLGHRAGEVAIGGRDETDVGLQRRRAADSLVPPLLQHAQELGLRRRSELAELVEKQLPPAASSKRPRFRLSAPVMAPRSWPNSSDVRTLPAAV